MIFTPHPPSVRPRRPANIDKLPSAPGAGFPCLLFSAGGDDRRARVARRQLFPAVKGHLPFEGDSYENQ